MEPMTRVEKKELKKRIIFGLLITLISILVIMQILKKTAFFNIKYIDIKGIDKEQAERLLKDSNIKKGKSSFDVSIYKEKSKFMRDPYVKNIKVKRKLPNRIFINVDEKKEVLKIKNGKNYVVIDEKGTILDIREKVSDKVTSLNGVKFKEKMDRGKIEENVFDYIDSKGIIDFIKLNQEIDILYIFKDINFLKGNTIEIVTFDNKQINFGRLSKTDYKVKMLNEIFEYIENEEIAYEKILMDKSENPIIVREKNTEKSENKHE